jgi:adenine-specific DNA-methyltransferase
MSNKAPATNRIYLGDATQLISAWPRQFVDLVVTDPPYGNNATYGRAGRSIVGDEHPLVGLQVVAGTYRLLKRDAVAYVFCASHHLGFLEHFFLRYSAFKLREVLIWDKRQIGFGKDFRRAHECVLVLEKGEPKYVDTPIPTVLSVKRASTTLHPHAKPVALLERLIRTASAPGDLVLDPFAGSGSTCLAAQRLQRRFIGVEIASPYVQIARDRLRNREAVA